MAECIGTGDPAPFRGCPFFELSMTPRSYLFVPADRPERFAKALQCGADAVIVDLEDAVPAVSKDTARASLAAWLNSPAASPVLLRLNAPDTPWFEHDLGLAGAAAVHGIVLPKAEQADDIARLHRLRPGLPLLPLVETAAGFEALRAVAAAPGVQRLLFGSIDFQADLGIEGDDDALLFFRSQIVLVSRLAGLAAPVDGVTTDLHDMATTLRDTARARRLGFAAKLCIHPRQVDAVNQGFTPSGAECEWARRVIAAAQAAGGAAVAVDGRMVDAPVLLRARSLLARAGRPG
jgi:citrate lyase subunit beta / citryl-CoA lyase